MSFVIDSNVLVYLLAGDERVARCLRRLAERGERASVSLITRIEVLGHSSVTPAAEEEIRRFFDCVDTFGLSDAVVERTIALRRATRLKLPDAVIAATALESGGVLVTHDLRGFGRVSGLRIIDPLSAAGLDDVPPPDTGPSTAGEKRVPYRRRSVPKTKNQ